MHIVCPCWAGKPRPYALGSCPASNRRAYYDYTEFLPKVKIKTTEKLIIRCRFGRVTSYLALMTTSVISSACGSPSAHDRLALKR